MHQDMRSCGYTYSTIVHARCNTQHAEVDQTTDTGSMYVLYTTALLDAACCGLVHIHTVYGSGVQKLEALTIQKG